MSLLIHQYRDIRAIQPGFPPGPGPLPDPELPPLPGPDEVPPEPIDDPRPLPDYEDTPPVKPIDRDVARFEFG